MKPDCSLTYLQELLTDPYPKPHEPSPRPDNLSYPRVWYIFPLGCPKLK